MSLAGPFPWVLSLSQNSSYQLSFLAFSPFSPPLSWSPSTAQSSPFLSTFTAVATPCRAMALLSVASWKHLSLADCHHFLAPLWLWALSPCASSLPCQNTHLCLEADARHGQGPSAGRMAEEELGNVTSCCSLAQKSCTNAASVSSAFEPGSIHSVH